MPQQQRGNLMLRHCQRLPPTLGAMVGGGLAQAKVSSREARELGRSSAVQVWGPSSQHPIQSLAWLCVPRVPVPRS